MTKGRCAKPTNNRGPQGLRLIYLNRSTLVAVYNESDSLGRLILATQANHLLVSG